MRPNVIRIDQHTRVTADLAGEPVWFESADIELLPSAEAFAGLALVPAAHRRDRIRVEAPLSPIWVTSTRQILAIHREWWGTADDFPLDVSVGPSDAPPLEAAAALFSGGVDSFYTALRPPSRLGALVFVQGFDMPLSDDQRASHFTPAFRRIAGALGVRAIFIRTNVREHAYFNSIAWERTHGAALTAIGHLLADQFGKLIIPSSSTLDDVGLWGSHWRTDPLWRSGRVEFVHHDPAIHRNDKLARIAHEPLLWDSLRVCWENRTESGNCSTCEKCVKTMVLLAASHQLPNYRVFDLSVPLARRIDALTSAPVHMVHVWTHVQALDLPPDTKAAIGRLIARSRWEIRAASARRLLGRLRSHIASAVTRGGVTRGRTMS
jgi:hypothetical protein